MADAVREGRVTRNLELVVEQPAGSRVVVTVNVDPLFGRDGRVVGAIDVFSDVTADRQPEAVRRNRVDAARR